MASSVSQPGSDELAAVGGPNDNIRHDSETEEEVPQLSDSSVVVLSQ